MYKNRFKCHFKLVFRLFFLDLFGSHRGNSLLEVVFLWWKLVLLINLIKSSEAIFPLLPFPVFQQYERKGNPLPQWPISQLKQEFPGSSGSRAVLQLISDVVQLWFLRDTSSPSSPEKQTQHCFIKVKCQCRGAATNRRRSSRQINASGRCCALWIRCRSREMEMDNMLHSQGGKYRSRAESVSGLEL